MTSCMPCKPHSVLSANPSGVASTADSRCTNGCTSETENSHATDAEADPPTTKGPGDFAAALATIALLPLTDAEKADAVRRLLREKDERP